MFGRIRQARAGSKPVATKPLSAVEAQCAYEKQEHQRRNPHLYTTLHQCVNADGSLLTFDHVTRKQQEVIAKLQEIHCHQFAGPHPDYCMKGMESDVCKLIEMNQDEMDKVGLTFVRNYHMMRGRINRSREETLDA